MKKLTGILFALLLLISSAQAQAAEVTIQLNEPFFDALLDALFKDAGAPEFPLAGNILDEALPSNSFGPSAAAACRETIRLQREIAGTRTAVQFREGRISAPIAFAGSYNPPLVGCIDFSGVAQTTIDLEFDNERQSLVGRARVNDVNLSGSGGIGGGLLARMVQNSIDKKINPIQILAMDKITFMVPIQNSGSLKMRATGIRHEIANGVLNVKIGYAFEKGS